MICPNCGRANLAEKKYCPSCGLKLEAIAHALAIEQAHHQGETLEFSRPPQRSVPSALTIGFLAFIFGTLVSVVGGGILGKKLVADMGVIIMVLGMGGIGYGAITGRGRRAMSSPPSKTILPQVQTNPLPITVQSTSIAEHTTRSLEARLDTNPALKAAPAYQSIIQDEPRQFATQPRNQ